MGGDIVRNERMDLLNDSQQEMISGGGLSKRFSRLPLWLSHPSNIGAFYGLLVSLALILPYRTTEEFWFPLWLLHASLLIFATALLGMCSRIINSISGRLPVTVYRKYLYPMPFLGFTLFTLIHTDLLASNIYSEYLAWGLLMIPGPLYIHLSWAPRWRLLCLIEDGTNPIKWVPTPERSEEISEVAGDDSDLIEVVESFGENE